MEQVKKLKAVMLCGFSNQFIRSYLNLKNNRIFFNLLIKLFKLSPKVGQYHDAAPWISNLIDEFEKREDIELHVISKHLGLRSNIQEFVSSGIYYHFYKSEISSFFRIIDNFKIWKSLQLNSFFVKKIVNNINPDIVNVVGIENPTTAIPAYYIEGIPIYVLSQTIYSNPDRFKYSKPKKINWDLELALHSKLKYFGVYSRMHYDLLKENNPEAIVFDYSFPSKPLPEVKQVEKEYEFVNFSLSLDLRKGAHDSLKALAIVKEKYPAVRLNFIGNCQAKVKSELDDIIEKFGLHNNVVFTPFFEKQSDMFQHLQKSRFAVLPCKMDVTSGTMSQSMYYKLPLVVYKTTGTPKYNKDNECVLIAEMNNIEDLAEKMLFLMHNPDKAKQLSENAHEYIINSKDNNKVIERLVANYHAIIDHYNNQTPIPKELLFDIEKYPIYS